MRAEIIWADVNGSYMTDLMISWVTYTLEVHFSPSAKNAGSKCPCTMTCPLKPLTLVKIIGHIFNRHIQYNLKQRIS